MIRRFFQSLTLLITLMVMGLNLAHASQTVRVLAYPFPPFLLEDKKSGLTVDLIKLFNTIQSDYKFELVISDPQDRFAHLIEGNADMVLFEKLEWNWEDKQDYVAVSRTFLKDGEVYIARRDNGLGDKIFDDVETRHLALYEGYHYEFADYNADPTWLKANFKVSFSKRHDDIIDSVRQKDSEVGIVTLSYLKKYFKQHPDRIETFLVSDNFAQRYDLKAILRKAGPMNIEKFEKLLNALKSDYHLQDLLEEYSILREWVY